MYKLTSGNYLSLFYLDIRVCNFFLDTVLLVDIFLKHYYKNFIYLKYNILLFN
jgi:hypothetical protein